MNADQLPLFEDAPTDDIGLRCLFDEPWLGEHPLCEQDADRMIASLRYPQVAGSKATETSRAAGASVDAETLRAKVLTVLETMGPLTPDVVAHWLGVDRLAIRPRFSELKRLGLIDDSGDRRKNASGKAAIVWRVR